MFSFRRAQGSLPFSTFSQEQGGSCDDDEDSANEEGILEWQVGDHIYSWCAMGTYQRHGIILSVSKVLIVVVEFFPESTGSDDAIGSDGAEDGDGNRDSDNCSTNDARATSDGRSTSTVRGGVRAVSMDEWRSVYGKPNRVRYSSYWLRRSVQRAGTCTSVESDPTGLVVARVRFLMDREDDAMPPYHMLHANSENAAVWCKTGRWATIQVSDFLYLTAAGQLKSAGSLGIYVSNHSLAVPTAGFCVDVHVICCKGRSCLGFTTKASLVSTQLSLLPLIAGYGIVTVCGPAYMLRKCRAQWAQTTEGLHEQFWSWAPPEVFVECIHHWSGLNVGKP